MQTINCYYQTPNIFQLTESLLINNPPPLPQASYTTTCQAGHAFASLRSFDKTGVHCVYNYATPLDNAYIVQTYAISNHIYFMLLCCSRVGYRRSIEEDEA